MGTQSPHTEVPVSVVLYVHNGGDYLAEALASVLDQTHSLFELCAVDDGSTDSTAAILDEAAARDPRVRVEHQPAHGRLRLHETFNNCLAMTSFDLIAIANADDTWRRDKLERQVQKFVSEPSLDVCTHEAVFVDDQGRVMHGGFRGVPSPHELRDIRPWHFVAGNPIPNPTAMFHRRILRSAGLQEVGEMHDHQFWFKVAVHGASFVSLPDRLIRYRIHEASHSTARDRRPAIVKAHGECVEMMLDRYALEDIVPELDAVDSGDGRNRAWALSHIGELLWKRRPDLSVEYFRRALREADNLALVTALGMAMVAQGDRYGGLPLLRSASEAGVGVAAAVLSQPGSALMWSPPVWWGDEPPVAALVHSGEAVTSARRAGVVDTGSPDMAIVLDDPSVDPETVARSLADCYLGRGSRPTRLVVLGSRDVPVDTVVEGYELAVDGLPGLDEGLAVEFEPTAAGDLDSICAAYLMDAIEVVRPASRAASVCRADEGREVATSLLSPV